MESARPPGQPEPVKPGAVKPAVGRPGSGHAEATRQLTVITAGYAMLFLLGIAEGVVGSFQYSGGIGAVPAAALGFDALILVTCLLAAWGMLRPAAALMPAVGWFAAAFVLAMRTPGGSIVITNTTAGKWFLFGGAACAAAGVIASFTMWSAARLGRGELPGRSRGPGLGGWSGQGELRSRKSGS